MFWTDVVKSTSFDDAVGQAHDGLTYARIHLRCVSSRRSAQVRTMTYFAARKRDGGSVIYSTFLVKWRPLQFPAQRNVKRLGLLGFDYQRRSRKALRLNGVLALMTSMNKTIEGFETYRPSSIMSVTACLTLNVSDHTHVVYQRR